MKVVQLNHRQIADMHTVRPVHTWNHTVMPVCHLITVVVRVLRLPEHRSPFNMQLHQGPHQQVGDDVTSAVKAVVPGNGDTTAAHFCCKINCLLNRIGIVGKTVALGAAVEHIDIISRRPERIRIRTKVRVVFDQEPLVNLLPRIPFLRKRKELVRKA